MSFFKAEQWFKTALEEDKCESGTENDVSDVVIKLNLCTVAIKQNDPERLCALLSELEEMKEEDDSEFTDRCRYMMQFGICVLYGSGYLELDEETAERFKDDIEVLKEDIIKNEVSDKRCAARSRSERMHDGDAADCKRFCNRSGTRRVYGG